MTRHTTAKHLKSFFFSHVTDENLDDDGYNLADMLKRDKRRWEKADTDSDGKLSKEEFSNFLHPEEVDHMRDIVIDVSDMIEIMVVNKPHRNE